MGQSRPLLSFIFSLFQQASLQILQQINVKKCPFSIPKVPAFKPTTLSLLP